MGKIFSKSANDEKKSSSNASEETENVGDISIDKLSQQHSDLKRQYHDVLKAQYSENLNAAMNAKPINNFRRISNKINTGIGICLIPHEHSLFCERKERICKSVGKLQEHEKLRVKSKVIDLQSNDISFSWMRSPPGVFGNFDDDNDGLIDDTSVFELIEGTEGLSEYELTVDDVDAYVTVRVFQRVYHTMTEKVEGYEANEEFIAETADTHGHEEDAFTVKEHDAEAAMGPVLAGPPRLLDLSVVGDMTVGSTAIANIKYIGGRPGASEFWWIRIRDGDREQISDARAINIADANVSDLSSGLRSDDPRIYKIMPDDQGCILKVKCRPVRSDGHRGEIFTSKPSAIITSGHR